MFFYLLKLDVSWFSKLPVIFYSSSCYSRLLFYLSVLLSSSSAEFETSIILINLFEDLLLWIFYFEGLLFAICFYYYDVSCLVSFFDCG